jgi:hypothetical protein
MPGIIHGPNDWAEDTLFSAPRPPLERPHAPARRLGPDTSQKAAEAALGASGTQRRAIYELIVSHGGLTADEVSQLTGWPPQSVTARINGLLNDGWLVDSGQRRNTRWGREARVYTHAKEAA